MSFVHIAGRRALLALFALSGMATYSFAQAPAQAPATAPARGNAAVPLTPVTPLQTTTIQTTTIPARAQTTTVPTPNGTTTTTTQSFAAATTFAPLPAATAASNIAGSPAYWENHWNWYNNIYTPYFRQGRLGYAPTQPNYGYAPDYGYRGGDYRSPHSSPSIFYGAVQPGAGKVTMGRLYGIPSPTSTSTAFPPHSGMFPQSTQ